jgi:hypothetical protein
VLFAWGRDVSDKSLMMLENLALAGISASTVRSREFFPEMREIENSDLEPLVREMREHNWTRENTSAPTIRVLRVGHHQLAQLLAAGTSAVDAAFITGKSTGTIGLLLKDPSFNELLSYYTEQQKGRDLNVYDKLVTIGALASEILQERLEEKPETFSNNELKNLLELAAPKSGGQSSAGNVGLNVAINFVPGDRGSGVVEAKVIEDSVRVIEGGKG